MKLILLSSLEKIMRNEAPSCKDFRGFSMLNNEKKSFQLYIEAECDTVSLDIKSDLDGIHAYTVEFIPSKFAINEKTADDYVIRSKDGYYPDLLLPVDGDIQLENGRRTLWFEIDSESALPTGEHTVELTVSNGNEKESAVLTVEVIGCPLEKQSLIFTNWFHTDCLMDEYKVSAFSDEYWRIVQNYLKTAVRHGMNCVLTPLFTPPLDTQVFGERPTVQLVDVTVSKGEYTFGFDRLLKWIHMARDCGIEYFELSHFFTQWGARHAPKIVATVHGKTKKIFGWKTIAVSKKYRDFLTQFSTALKAFIEAHDLKDKVLIHVSDEPNKSTYRTYVPASRLIHELFEGYKIVDALSDYKFYENGIVTNPIVNNYSVKNFIGKVPELWTYYCCGQDHDYVSNRYFSIPSQRTRVLGYQLYKFDAKGFLHWGFNFWYTRFSRRKINPYEVTDAGGSFQSGDSFVVYPKSDGTPLCSLRLKVFYDAFQDMMALQTLERLTDRATALAVLEERLEKELTFSRYPHSNGWLLETRERINQAIKAHLS